ncbi:MAG: hypothetical protein DWQ08_02685 [Proteobacteria bacterium]|nr:MAG: hypothetical protein DWQ08_02685 [Pseudomonadota bacterium]
MRRGVALLPDSAVLLALSVAIGVTLPPLASLFRPLIYPSIFFLILLSLLVMDLPRLLRELRGELGAVMRVSLWNMLALPAAVAALHLYTPLGGQITGFAFYTACAATIFGAPAFARLMGLDEPLTLKGTLAAVLVMPVTLPVLAGWVRGSAEGFSLTAYGWRLVVFLVVPLAIALACHSRPRLAEALKRSAPVHNGSVFFLCLFAIGIMDGIGARFVEAPGRMFSLLAAALAIHVVLFVAGALAFARSGASFALAAGLLASYRNLGLLLAVAGPLLPKDFIVFVAIWQVPMYLTPLVMRRFGIRAGG